MLNFCRHFLKARATQYRSALSRLERNCCFRTALGARRSRLRAYPLSASRALRLALLAVLGIVLELFIVEKDLLARCKYELRAAVYTFKHAIGKFHGRLPPQGRSPKSAMALSSLPVPVPCIRSSFKTRARTAPKIERFYLCPNHSGSLKCHTPKAREAILRLFSFGGVAE